MSKKDVLIVCGLEQETQGQLDDYDVLYTGVGKVNATFKLTQRLQVNRSLPPMPKLVINYGTAGSRELPVGELVDCTKFIQRDMNVTGLGFTIGQTPFEHKPTVTIKSTSEFNPIGRNALCGSGDNFVEDRINYYGDVVDMEAYALAKVCYYYDVPFISFKYITDRADDDANEDWEDNLSDGIKVFKEKVLDLIEKNS